jgi:RNA polymerase sigma-70 factor (ECF subfamily)
MPDVRTRRRAEFPETRWSKISRLRAQSPESAEVHQALEELCELYWFPLYAFARRSGCAVEDAEDLTQGFFHRLVHGGLFAQADRQKGRLRSFLLGAFTKFLAEQHRNARRLKRGGGVPLLSLNTEEAESLYRAELADSLTPEGQFERTWARTLLQNALSSLESEYQKRGQAALFEQLHGALALDGAAPIADYAQALQMSAGAVRVSIHRLRQRFRRLLREQIAATVKKAEEVDEELRHLGRVLGNSSGA